jgi:hypothetical protein
MHTYANGFTDFKLHNRFGGCAYRDCPELLNGTLQRQCQDALRQHRLNDDSPSTIVDIIQSDPAKKDDEGNGDLKWEIFFHNIGYALSAPCDDYEEMFRYIRGFGYSETTLRQVVETTRWIKESNIINPYLAFRCAPVELWAEMNPLFDYVIKQDFIKMIAIFDDVEMAKKLDRYDLQLSATLVDAQALVQFDPLSQLRGWLQAPQGISMREVEGRIKAQFEALGSNADMMEKTMYKLSPESLGDYSFQAGLFSTKTLTVNSKDHLLRLLPRYHDFLKTEGATLAKLIGDYITGMDTQVMHPGVMAILTNDLQSSNITNERFYFQYYEKHSAGAYMDLQDQPDALRERYMRALLACKGAVDYGYSYGSVFETLLSFETYDDIMAYAKTDDELASAYKATNNPDILEKMSSRAISDQLCGDLGL